MIIKQRPIYEISRTAYVQHEKQKQIQGKLADFPRERVFMKWAANVALVIIVVLLILVVIFAVLPTLHWPRLGF
ncbi:hypothetical protein [Furfurilactobacillus rossiae]|uniref:Uncharacterized protein n=1 Tax=Furfurilactobacillus rossiae DSM 15814 TaxID=1114972 RepID=A0A0R1RBM3_9LACO|nr:hypothetical protein [Furfurilactobacillus rossiae]KRL53993.1 hypothetical protein FD35_GL000696 [Furfurilactobacillus rossiae DSM 15814]QFR68248.1 hypothetical protein LR814_13885 [Furfurilactobacillus rossiae]QLE62692.1 hypothetical protein LROSRS0_p10056 [Furfurilactobacillus rossiae]HAT54111.1 hypothetical protein [Lactobacillus sp.]